MKNEQAQDNQHLESETVVSFGGSVKSLDDEGKIGGYLVLFSTPADPDLVGDFFTKDTDFGDQESSPIMYAHGLDSTLKARRFSVGSIKVDDVGVWIEGQLQMRDEYEKAILDLIKQGKLGWSSGTASHLVSREPVEKSWHITSWPLGLDASLTPTPAEPRTSAVTLKAFHVQPFAELRSKETQSTEAGSLPAAAGVESTSEAAHIKTAMDQHLSGTPEHLQTSEPTASQPVEAQKSAETLTSNETQYVTIPFSDWNALQQKVYTAPTRVVKATYDTTNVNLKTKPGDSEVKAIAHWIRTGDVGAVKSLMTEESTKSWGFMPQGALSIKASNDTTMNITTAADGGDLVPTGHFQGIIAKRDEDMLSRRLGVRNIPGKGTTVNVPIDNEALADGDFISTAEETASDRDAPAVTQVAMTLSKYTKRVELTDEILLDEDSALLAFIENYIGRKMATTHNSLLVTEVTTNGTSFKTFGSNSALADGEIEDIEANDNLSGFLEGGGTVAWVTRNATLAALRKITASGPRPYATASTGGPGVIADRELIGYPVLRSNKVAAIATTAKSILFGNWAYVGVRNEPEFRLLRDPYSAANSGVLRLHYYFRTVYSVLQAEAIGFGEHPV